MKLVKDAVDADIYKDTLEETEADTLSAYYDLLLKYAAFDIKDTFVKMRGLDTISNVFFMTLNSTHNLGAAITFGDKACYLYAEFVSQISEIEKLFLRLTSRDAALYVYNKTIFLLNRDKMQEHDKHYAFALLKSLLTKTILSGTDVSHFRETGELIKRVHLYRDTLKTLEDLYFSVDDAIMFYNCAQFAIVNQRETVKKHEFNYKDFDVVSFNKWCLS
jgi:hypothetical protein